MGATLLDPSLARELDALRRQLQIRARSGAEGRRTSKRRGGAAEFLEHRAYGPGDDPRRIDWLAFARAGTPVIKLFRAEDDVMVRLLVDGSASMDFGEPSKLVCARRIAASLGYLALAGSERAQVFLTGEAAPRAHDPLRGRSSLARLLTQIDTAPGAGATDLARSIEAVVKRSARPGMLVVLSDYLDGGPLEGALRSAAVAGHDLALVQVLAPEELSPAWRGDHELVDMETGQAVEITFDDASIQAYLGLLHALFDSLATTARRIGASYVRTSSDDPAIETVRRVVAGGVS